MAARAQACLLTHQAHDAGALLSAWEELVSQQQDDWEKVSLGQAGDYEVFALCSRVVPAHRGRGRDFQGLYVSAGVHGDEAAPPWALLEWFRQHHVRLARHPVTVVPCFNPVGLVLNTRVDHFNEDLNRQFHREDRPIVQAWREMLRQRSFALALCLHEDYDGRGLYCYELCGEEAPSLGAQLMARASRSIPCDPRPHIEGWPAVNGLIRRTFRPRGLPGMPEALALWKTHTLHTLTFETPSEYSLYDRIRSQKLFLDEALRVLGWW